MTHPERDSEKKYSIYGYDEDGDTRRGYTGQFTCECGRSLRAGSMTECYRCGAHYERDSVGDRYMIQTAPPIPFTDSEGENGP